LKRAEQTIQEHQMMTLNTKNSRTFFDALDSPVRFNQELTAAFEEHDKRVISICIIFGICVNLRPICGILYPQTTTISEPQA